MKFEYNDHPVNYIRTTTITDYEIILIYWVYWQNEVFTRRPDNTFSINTENCILDFIIIHGAKRIE